MLTEAKDFREQIHDAINEASGPLSPAALGVDWDASLHANEGALVARYEALTPEGAVYLAELAEIGTFGEETQRSVRDIAH